MLSANHDPAALHAPYLKNGRIHIPSILTEHAADTLSAAILAFTAYVLNLTPRWRPDWGGLLQFFDQAGNVEGGFTPTFNALNMFSIPKPHAVSQVATFAGGARYSITGWLRAE